MPHGYFVGKFVYSWPNMVTADWRIRYSHLASTLFHSLVRGDVRGESGPR